MVDFVVSSHQQISSITFVTFFCVVLLDLTGFSPSDSSHENVSRAKGRLNLIQKEESMKNWLRKILLKLSPTREHKPNFNTSVTGCNVDTKTLVVGQDVYMLKPPYPFWFCIEEGKVVKVTPEGVDVQVVDRHAADAAYCQRKDRGDKAIKITPSRVEVQVADLQTADLIRFDTSGKETDVSRRDRLGFGPSPDDKFYTSLWQSAPEFGPWHLDEMPFAERTALLEQKGGKRQMTGRFPL
jgi:hypothetical protein